MKTQLMLTLLALPLFLCGCRLSRYSFSEPVTDSILTVMSGDRYTIELDENGTTGYTWAVTCDNDDVEVGVEHIAPNADRCGAPGKAIVSIRVHRGFGETATVEMKYRRPWSGECARAITYILNHDPTDEAPWK